MKTKAPPKDRPIRLRCTKAPKCKRGGWIERDDMMPDGTATVIEPCDRHFEDGYYDLQISYLDEDGNELEA